MPRFTNCDWWVACYLTVKQSSHYTGLCVATVFSLLSFLVKEAVWQGVTAGITSSMVDPLQDRQSHLAGQLGWQHGVCLWGRTDIICLFSPNVAPEHRKTHTLNRLTMPFSQQAFVLFSEQDTNSCSRVSTSESVVSVVQLLFIACLY